jgi:hypothetical protein
MSLTEPATTVLKTVSTFARNGNALGIFKDSVNAAVTFAAAEGRANQMRHEDSPGEPLRLLS